MKGTCNLYFEQESTSFREDVNMTVPGVEEESVTLIIKDVAGKGYSMWLHSQMVVSGTPEESCFIFPIPQSNVSALLSLFSFEIPHNAQHEQPVKVDGMTTDHWHYKADYSMMGAGINSTVDLFTRPVGASGFAVVMMNATSVQSGATLGKASINFDRNFTNGPPDPSVFSIPETWSCTNPSPPTIRVILQRPSLRRLASLIKLVSL